MHSAHIIGRIRPGEEDKQNAIVSEMIFCVIYYIFCEFSTATHITSFLFEILNLGNNHNSYLV